MVPISRNMILVSRPGQNQNLLSCHLIAFLLLRVGRALTETVLIMERFLMILLSYVYLFKVIVWIPEISLWLEK